MSPQPTPPDVTEAEFAVLRFLWASGPASIRTICDSLYPDGTSSDYATAKKLCERLGTKGFVAVDKRHRPHRFAARVDREELIGRRLQSVADKLCDGSFLPLISHLMSGDRLAKRDLDALRQKVEELSSDHEQDAPRGALQEKQRERQRRRKTRGGERS